MVDIITMLFTLVRNYFPAEVRWSPLQDVFDIFTFSMVMFTILYCQFFALRYAAGLWNSTCAILHLPLVLTPYLSPAQHTDCIQSLIRSGTSAGSRGAAVSTECQHQHLPGSSRSPDRLHV